jgi:hypothetical protein
MELVGMCDKQNGTKATLYPKKDKFLMFLDMNGIIWTNFSSFLFKLHTSFLGNQILADKPVLLLTNPPKFGE